MKKMPVLLFQKQQTTTVGGVLDNNPKASFELLLFVPLGIDVRCHRIIIAYLSNFVIAVPLSLSLSPGTQRADC